jgi:aconitase B
MGIKQIKELKKELEDKLNETISALIADAKITAEVSDSLEILRVGIMKQQDKDASTQWKTENYITYNINDKDNIIFQGTNITTIFNNTGNTAGVLVNNSQIDLNTLYTLQQTLYKFAINHELIELNNEEVGDGVGAE